jgi:hypothetical protein
MPPELLNILIQIPMVGVVIWLYKQFMDFLREEREIRRVDMKEERELRRMEFDKLALVLEKGDKSIASVLLDANSKLDLDIQRLITFYVEAQTNAQDHDTVMKLALAKMEERTRPK